MIGIQEVGVYVPSQRVSNYERKQEYSIDDQFIEVKLGIRSVAVKNPGEEASDLAAKAFENLCAKSGLASDSVDCLVVVTQNPDHNLPHTSAIVHEKLELPSGCAAFDVSLGCSGFVYGLSIIEAFMERNGLEVGVLITADPYSTIIDSQDRNTATLFGDAATATLITRHPRYVSGRFTFGTVGELHRDLFCENGRLIMNGRGVFNFALRYVPRDIMKLMECNDLALDQVDRFLFHQASKYMLDTIASRLKIPAAKAPWGAWDYGNTVSSSIPILLADEVERDEAKSIVICGFGVGLSWASGILRRLTE